MAIRRLLEEHVFATKQCVGFAVPIVTPRGGENMARSPELQVGSPENINSAGDTKLRGQDRSKTWKPKTRVRVLLYACPRATQAHQRPLNSATFEFRGHSVNHYSRLH
jgi:hypothetical protein